MSLKKSSEPILQVSNLRIERGGTLILDDVSWSVARGEHWVILGANGSGKTSLLSALAAYLTPTDGEIDVLGERFGETDWRELRKHIGIVSSSVRQMMHDEEPASLTVISGKYAMIDYCGRVEKADRARALKLLREMDCAYVAERPWGVLSQGERQRVLIARSLMANPKILILDEPCSGLDPVARENFLESIERLGRRSRSPSLVLVTHHVEEITPPFSRVLLLKNGRVLAAGAKTSTLTSRNLAEVFGSALRLRKNAGRYALSITSGK